MNNLNRTRRLVLSAVIAALYVAVNLTQSVILPGSTSSAVQFRVAEALCVLCIYSPAAVYGVTFGCAVSNLLSSGALPFDVIIGAAATFLSCIFLRKLKDVRLKGIPFLSLLMPVVFNGIIIGLEIEIFFIKGSFNVISFFSQGGLVALGEGLVMFTLGIALINIIKNKNLEKYLF